MARSKKRRGRRITWRSAVVLLGLATLGAGAVWVVRLDTTVRHQFEGTRWSLPAHVYSRPRQLHQGLPLNPAVLERELTVRGYRKDASARSPGTFRLGKSQATVYLRGFNGMQGRVLPIRAQVVFAHGRIVTLTADNGQQLDEALLEPIRLGSILPLRHEDRAPVALHQVPGLLLQGLLVMEDRRFMDHHGIDPLGVMRALLQNLRSGRVVAGGSTLTQQLVKNLYLEPSRTLRRKATEAVMALLLEWHYGKSEILEAYVNEVFLGQSGNRAIHGFALASEHYFGRPLDELPAPALALLAGMVKAPSAYDPRRHPQRARQRRNLVLAELVRAGQIDPARLKSLQASPLGLTSALGGTRTSGSAFFDYVRRQVQRHFDPAIVQTQGLRIHSTLDPLIQHAAQGALKDTLADLESAHKLPAGKMQGAIVVLQVDNGEVLAVVGGRQGSRGGFNRALDARRPVGSLLKPAVYLAALSRPHRYHLQSILDDSPFEWRANGAKPWRPRNYDRKDHGQVELIDALAQSYNVATARLGLTVGLEQVIKVLQSAGIVRPLLAFPSITLGAVDLAPVEIAQMYQSLASGGHRAPLRTIRWIADSDDRPLARYPLRSQQALDPSGVFLVNRALQEVVRSGTARALAREFPKSLALAGKTGTTDGYRDSWFVGYAGNILAVVWLGLDNNEPTGLTGASGALKVWARLMRQLPLRAVQLYQPKNITWARSASSLIDAPCTVGDAMPFVMGTQPAGMRSCSPSQASAKEKTKSSSWWQGIPALLPDLDSRP